MATSRKVRGSSRTTKSGIGAWQHQALKVWNNVMPHQALRVWNDVVPHQALKVWNDGVKLLRTRLTEAEMLAQETANVAKLQIEVGTQPAEPLQDAL